MSLGSPRRACDIARRVARGGVNCLCMLVVLDPVSMRVLVRGWHDSNRVGVTSCSRLAPHHTTISNRLRRPTIRNHGVMRRISRRCKRPRSMWPARRLWQDSRSRRIRLSRDRSPRYRLKYNGSPRPKAWYSRTSASGQCRCQRIPESTRRKDERSIPARSLEFVPIGTCRVARWMNLPNLIGRLCSTAGVVLDSLVF